MDTQRQAQVHKIFALCMDQKTVDHENAVKLLKNLKISSKKKAEGKKARKRKKINYTIWNTCHVATFTIAWIKVCKKEKPQLRCVS